MGLTQNRLKELLDYNPDTGIFSRYMKKIDKYIEIRSLNNGYIRIGVKQKKYYAHRLAFLYMTGNIPEYIDHINHKKTDNKFSNLRACTQSQNGANEILSKNNTSGYKGVIWDKSRSKWMARIKFNYKTIHLGRFNCKHEAAHAYNRRAMVFFGEFACLNEVIV